MSLKIPVDAPAEPRSPIDCYVRGATDGQIGDRRVGVAGDIRSEVECAQRSYFQNRVLPSVIQSTAVSTCYLAQLPHPDPGPLATVV